jgi:glycosyltransferase involved in cell wall biosynthesis
VSRILVVSPYPPARDGIAAYAAQVVTRLAAEGHDVEVLSPGPSAAHHHLVLDTPRGALALARRVRAYDKVVVQFHPDVFYRVPSPPADMIRAHLALAAAFRAAPSVEVWVHEIDYTWGRGHGPLARAARAVWGGVDRVVVHTEGERDNFVEAFGVRPDRVHLEEHGAAFVKRTSLDRAAARRSLGLPEQGGVFLAIGFVQPHKGFDRAVRAFTGLAEGGWRLDIVGSMRVTDPAAQAYAEELQSLVAATPGATLHDGFVSDELFDRWIVASDVVVLPYRHIWSSGVLERAALYGRDVIATRVGGLAQQAGQRDGVTLVADDAGLRAAMRAATGDAVVAPVERGGWSVQGPGPLRDRIQAAVVARAARRRGAAVTTVPAGPAAARPVTSLPGTGSGRVRQLHPLAPPALSSGRPGATSAKRLIRRLTGWETDPIVWQVNALRDATIAALDAQAAAVAALAAATGDRPDGTAPDSPQAPTAAE